MYFIIFRKHKEDKYRHYTNEYFLQKKKMPSVLLIEDFKRKQKDLWKIVDYNSENINKYWW